ncbi:PREDICTED: LOW QUALITY PROTEIN: F-box protein At3g19470-like [Camelina sativa]|uniref:LOW QUALITY PROTEIN: F-box protein At3g19470-like n=1 Tax=Camelina sativa TaxID=90675 RepID=A0ABM1R018_CAMSA|nr:PREDICTED: LOW QUALITY PROTEIN: F-box protein At3g19470-like [Camelina sativa]
MVVMMMNLRVYLMRVVNLHNNSNLDSYLKREVELISLGDEDEISQVFHCDGLLLCISITKTKTSLVVWNPYWGHTRSIEPTHKFHIIDMYSHALGYDKSSKSHKILRFINFTRPTFDEFKIYDFNSDSWRVLDVTPDWTIRFFHLGVTLEGNAAYWFATKKYSETYDDYFLVCFDFTRDTFGPFLPLPFHQFLQSQDK